MRSLPGVVAVLLVWTLSARAQVTVSSIVPDASTTDGRTAVAILGENFAPDSRVYFGETQAEFVYFLNTNQLRVLAPPHGRGLVDVTVATSSGLQSVLPGKFRYLDLALDLRPLLLPMYVLQPTPGALGSEFRTALRLMNTGNQPLRVAGILSQLREVGGVSYTPSSGVAQLAPGSVVEPAMAQPPRSANNSRSIPSRVIFVEREKIERFAASLQVIGSTSAGAPLPSAGTDVPIIDEQELKSGIVHILSVPVIDGFRTTIRVYDPDRNRTGTVLMRVLAQDLNSEHRNLLYERTLNLETLQTSEFEDVPSYPAYAQASLDVPEILNSGAHEVRIEIEPQRNDARLWAMASVTNNLTQEITLFTPE